MEVEGRHILVVGLGRTGASVVRFLVRRGARVTATDQADAASLGDGLAALSDLPKERIKLELGGHRTASFLAADLIVLSPGVPHTMEALQLAGSRHIPVIGEIELAWRFMQTPIIAITGTNGKSTTTLLTGQFLKDAGYRVFVGGNLGTPLIEYVDRGEAADFAVVEISSFQLDTIEAFRPKMALLLNITADHLDRYDDFAGYVRSKARIFKNQTADDMAVINQADPAIRSLVPAIAARVLPFNADGQNEAGARLENAHIRFAVPGRGVSRLDCSRSALIGVHNRENMAAAGLAAAAAGVSFEVMQHTIDHFQGLSHRMSPVATIRGVHYIDDSKATNVDAVVRALASFSTPVILIMGGREKGGGYSALKDLLPGRVRHLVVLGEAASAIERALGEKTAVTRVSSMAEAVSAAAAGASAGDTVLLSPACASFDMYESYAHRGADFVRCVHEIEAGDHE